MRSFLLTFWDMLAQVLCKFSKGKSTTDCIQCAYNLEAEFFVSTSTPHVVFGWNPWYGKTGVILVAEAPALL